MSRRVLRCVCVCVCVCGSSCFARTADSLKMSTFHRVTKHAIEALNTACCVISDFRNRTSRFFSSIASRLSTCFERDKENILRDLSCLSRAECNVPNARSTRERDISCIRIPYVHFPLSYQSRVTVKTMRLRTPTSLRDISNSSSSFSKVERRLMHFL